MHTPEAIVAAAIHAGKNDEIHLFQV